MVLAHHCCCYQVINEWLVPETIIKKMCLVEAEPETQNTERFEVTLKTRVGGAPNTRYNPNPNPKFGGEVRA